MKVLQFAGGNKDSKWIGLVAHGATTSPFREKDRIPTLLSPYVSEIYSIVLPMHCKEGIAIIQRKNDVKGPPKRFISTEGAISLIQEDIRPIVEGKKVLIVAYSLGALFLIKSWKLIRELSLDCFGVFIGCGLRITQKYEDRYRSFFNRESYINSGKREAMIRLHGNRIFEGLEEWIYTVENVALWLLMKPPSALLLSNDEMSTLLGDKNGVHFFNGEEDEAWPPEQIEWALEQWTNENKKLTAKLHRLKVPSHFDYFRSPHWDNLAKDIEGIVSDNIVQSKL